MLIKFIINEKEHSYQVDFNESIIEIKNKIITDHFNNADVQLTFTFVGNKPIREFGKYNLIPDQEIPHTLDYLKISNFSEIDRNYIFKVIKSNIDHVSNKKHTIKKYVPSYKQKDKHKDKQNNNGFCLNMVDFPPLS